MLLQPVAQLRFGDDEVIGMLRLGVRCTHPRLADAIALSPSAQQVFINAIEGYDTAGSDAVALRLLQQATQAGVSLAELQLDPDLRPLLSRTNGAYTASK